MGNECEMVLIDVNEFYDMILKFIGSEDYKRVLNSIQDTKESGFMTGLAFSSILMKYSCIASTIAEEGMGKNNSCKSEHCIFCTNHKSGDALYEVSKFDGAMDYISDIKFCPICGNPLRQ